jgi:Tol biopolymer transport system component
MVGKKQDSALAAGLLFSLLFMFAACGGSGGSPAGVAPLGGLIVFAGPDAMGVSQVFTIHPDGSNKNQLTQAPAQNFFPAWSHDGMRIAFTSTRTGAPEIWVMNADGSNQKQLTFPPGSQNFVPSWSRDGTEIAFASARTGLQPEIWLMNSDGSNQRQLTTTPTGTSSNAPFWSPDGTKILFASDRSGTAQVYSMDPDGSGVGQLTQPNGANFPDSNVPVFSPDGSKIAFWSGIEAQYGQV